MIIMGIYKLIILILAFILITSQKKCDYIQPTIYSDCYREALLDEEIKNDIEYCCYVNVDDNINCQGLTQEEYEDIPMNVLIAKSYGFKYEIHCYSSFVKISLLLLSFILFL